MAKFHVGQHVLLATLGAPVECTVTRVFPVSRKTGRQPYALRAKAGYTVGACEIELTAAPEPAPEPEYKFEIGDHALVNGAGGRFRDSLVRIDGRRISVVTGEPRYRLAVVEGAEHFGPFLALDESCLDVAA